MLVTRGVDTIRTQPHRDIDTYLVSTDDIAEILDIVIAGLRKSHDRHLSTGCLSVLLPSHIRARAGTHEKGIFPQCSKSADPATTISSVKSAFSAAGYGKDLGITHTLRNNKAIIVSRQSITECDYTPHTNSSTSSVLIQRGNGVSGAGAQIFNPFHDENLWSVRRPSSMPLPDKRSLVEEANMPADEHDIVSFPPLRPRSCTNDWVAPQPELENLHPERQRTPTLIQCGVDAHRGNTPVSDTEETSSISTSTPPRTTTFSSSSPAESPKNPTRKKSMGTSIGVASHRRRSTLHQIDQPDQTPDNTFLLDSLRRYSLMPLLEHTPEVLRRNTMVPKPLEDVVLSDRRRMSSRDMLEEILVKDTKAAKAAKTAKTRKAASQGSGSRHSSSSSSPSKTYRKAPRPSSGGSSFRWHYCLDDSVPHVCADEQPTPVSERSLEDSLR
ncbi:hypothetical protein PG993_009564 [Apiospora rasikravindrae]|uniref:Uncharacterized protein n=1 Tax=Apiospora rasikravindrae TaxID=990691 RepID=A0ABR1SJY2_9PEZI